MSGGNIGSPSKLLSPEDAALRLVDTLKDYFTWKMANPETGKPSTRVLLKSPPGLGKTQTAFEQAIDYQLEMGEGQPYTFSQAAKHSIGDVGRTGIARTLIITHRHHLAREAKERIETTQKKRDLPANAPILRGRTHKTEESDPPCKRWKEVAALQKKGYPVFSNLCRYGSGKEVSECPYY